MNFADTKCPRYADKKDIQSNIMFHAKVNNK